MGETPSAEALGQIGGSSNTPLSAVISHSGISVLPPVVDTVYLSISGPVTLESILPFLEAADALDGEPCLLLVRRQRLRLELPPEGAPEPAGCTGWSLRRGRLNGYASYRWIFDGRGDWAGLTVLLAPPRTEGGAWSWFVMWRSERLWLRGHLRGKSAAELIAEDVARLGSDPVAGTDARLMAQAYPLDKWRVSRLDVCRDHFGYEWSVEDLRRFATSCPAWSRGMAQSGAAAEAEAADGWTYGNKDATTFYVGRRGSQTKFLRIYGKSAEAEKSGKIQWLAPYWRKLLFPNGEHGPLPKVWRAEVEFGGGWLKAHGFANASHLIGCEWALWEYYTGANRHVRPVRGGRQLRHCATSPVWQALQSPPSACPLPVWEYEPAVELERAPDFSALHKQAAGCLRRVVIAHGATEHDEETLREEVRRVCHEAEERIMASLRCPLPTIDPKTTRAARLAAAPSAVSPYD